MDTTSELPLVFENLTLVHRVMCMTDDQQNIFGGQHDHFQRPVPSERSLFCLVGRFQEIAGLGALRTEQVSCRRRMIVAIRSHIHQHILTGQKHRHHSTPDNVVLGTLLKCLHRYSDPLGHIVIIIIPEGNEFRTELERLLQTYVSEKPYRLPSLDMMVSDLDSLLLLDARPILLRIIRIINDDPVKIGILLTLETLYGKIKAEATVIRWGAHHHQGLVHRRGLRRWLGHL